MSKNHEECNNNEYLLAQHIKHAHNRKRLNDMVKSFASFNGEFIDLLNNGFFGDNGNNDMI